MSNILRSVSQIEEAPAGDLVATFNALTGRSIKKFENATIAKRKVEAAMMASIAADEKLGVAKGASGEVKTLQELSAKAAEKGLVNVNPLELPDTPIPETGEPGSDQPGDIGDNVDPGPIEFAPGSMAAQLVAVGAKTAPITKRERKAATEPKTPRVTIVAARLTGGGRGKGQPGSARTAVLERIRAVVAAKTEANAVEGAEQQPLVATIAELEAHLQYPVKGHIQKLVALGFVVAVDAAGKDIEGGIPAAPAPAPAPEAPSPAPAPETGEQDPAPAEGDPANVGGEPGPAEQQPEAQE